MVSVYNKKRLISREQNDKSYIEDVKILCPSTLQQQKNGNDCGIFCIFNCINALKQQQQLTALCSSSPNLQRHVDDIFQPNHATICNPYVYRRNLYESLKLHMTNSNVLASEENSVLENESEEYSDPLAASVGGENKDVKMNTIFNNICNRLSNSVNIRLQGALEEQSIITDMIKDDTFYNCLKSNDLTVPKFLNAFGKQLLTCIFIL